MQWLSSVYNTTRYMKGLYLMQQLSSEIRLRDAAQGETI